MRNGIALRALLMLTVAFATPFVQADDFKIGLGPIGGYMEARGADNGTWYGGLSARARFVDYLGAEASFTVHEDWYLNGNAVVTQYPIQLTAMVYPFPQWTVEPYGLAGIGWYYTRVDYVDELSFLNGESGDSFGYHLGAGVNVKAGFSDLFADIRYIFMDDPGFDNGNMHGSDYNAWQVTFGMIFWF